MRVVTARWVAGGVAGWDDVFSQVTDLALPVVGFILASRRPANRIGWLFLAAGAWSPPRTRRGGGWNATSTTAPSKTWSPRAPRRAMPACPTEQTVPTVRRNLVVK